MNLADISKDITKVLIYLEQYITALEEIEPFFELEGRKIVEICENVPKKTAIFKHYSSELKAVINLIVLKQSEFEGKKWRSYNEGYSRQLSAKDIQNYIKGEKDYNDFSEFILEVQLVKDKIDDVIEALNVMHWQMSNITKLHIASLEDYEL